MDIPGVLSKPLRTVMDLFDLDRELDSPMLVNQLVEIKAELDTLQGTLDESRRIAKEKDRVIAELRVAMATKDDLVLDGSAYFLRKGGAIVDGPFCALCFDRDHATVRLLQVPKPEGGAGELWEWVECPKCGMPFRSRRAGEYLNGPPATTRRKSSAAKKPGAAKSAQTAKRPRRTAR